MRRQYETVTKNFETFQRNADSEKKKITDDYERRIKLLNDDLDRMKSSSTRKAIGSGGEQTE